MSDEWRNVVGLEGVYEVSDAGDIRRIKAAQGARAGHLMTQIVDKTGHHHVSMRKDGRYAHALVHRLVAFAFIGPQPEGCEVCHNDGNPHNNAVSNLRWDTSSANKYDAVRHGTHVQARKTHCPQGHKFTPENTYIGGNGGRNCRTCNSESQARYRQRRRNKRRSDLTKTGHIIPTTIPGETKTGRRATKWALAK